MTTPRASGRAMRVAGVVIALAVLTIGVVLAGRVGSQPPAPARGSSVWVATLGGLVKASITDGSVVQRVLGGPALLVGVDDGRGRVWAYGDDTLVAVDSKGQVLVSVATPKTPPTALLARALAIDPDTGAAWLALGQRLHHVRADGTLLASVTLPDPVRGVVFDAKEGRLWVATRFGVAPYDAAGQRGPGLNLGPRPEVTAVAVDAATGDVWVALEKRLRRHQARGALVFEVGIGDLVHLADDGAGGVWTATVSRIRRLGPTGHILVDHRPFADGIVISGLASDPGDQSVWVSGLLTLRHVGARGEWLAGPTMPGVVFGLALLSGNRNPIAQDDTATTRQNVPVEIAVLTNDSDPDGDTLAVVAVAQPSRGSVAIDSTGTSVTYTPSANALGPDTFTYTISDGHGGTATAAVTVSVTPANRPPIAVDDAATTPEDTPVTITVLGNDSDPDGDTLAVAATTQGAHGAVTFTATTVTYTPRADFNGADSFTYTVRDPAGATAVATVRVTVTPVNDAPVVSLTASPVAGTAPLKVVLTATASDPDGDTLTYAWDFGDGQTKASGAASETHTYQAAGSFTVRVTVSDGLASASATASVRADASGLPPDPGTVAPPVAPGVATTVARGTEFLYSGANPIQTGVAPGTIEARRAAVVRGRVVARDGSPLSGVRITIQNHPELGETSSRADGRFDMAVNGGAPLTIDYRKAGLLPAQRQVDVPWQDYAFAPEVVLIPLDTQASAIDLTAGAMQVARGSATTDADGTRRGTLLFPSGTQAALVLPSGATQAIGSLTVRATEYTVGPEGPRAMPAALPPTSGYTYAVELSADEAIAAGARGVTFSQPVIYHVENFLNFPVGEITPVGLYDRDQGQWLASPNGRVIQIVSVAGGLAQLDTTGNGAVDNGAALGVSDAERQQLASLYPVGQSLWRVPIPHFTPFDINWPFGPPAGAESPNQPNPKNTKPGDDPCEASGSIIECHNQVLGERVGLVGVPFGLNYRSGRTPGYTPTRSLEIPLTSATIPPPLKRVDLTVSIAGVQFPQSFAALPNQTARFTWDGKDAYGRQLQGAQVANVVIGYVYDALYGQAANLVAAWAQTTGGGRRFQYRTTSSEFTLTQTFTVTIENWDARPIGLGGWTLDAHHAYDPIAQVLYRGDGSRRSAAALDRVITTVAGNGDCCFFTSQDGGPATQAAINPEGIAVGRDGSLYIVGSNDRLRRVTPDGTIVTIAGSGDDLSDGIPASQARLLGTRDVAVGPDGSIYVSVQHRIRRITPDGIISTVAGTGTAGFSGDGGPGTQAQLESPIGLAVGPDSAVYVADTGNNRIRRIGPEGIISTVAGSNAGGCSGDGGLATGARLSNPEEVAIGPDGSLYIVDCETIRRVGTDGVITRFAGVQGGIGLNADGIPAVQALLNAPRGVAVAPDGTVYIGESLGRRVRQVVSHGIITTAAGTGGRGFAGDGGPATKAVLNLDQFSFDADVAVGPDGTLYIADYSNRRVRRVGPALPGFAGAQFTVASGDAREVYAFDADGRHLRTLDALTGAALFEFTYDAGGRLASVVEKTGSIDNVTTIEHDGAGNPTAIVAPFGQRTVLGVAANGFLTSIANPASEATQATYSSNGLLLTFTDPRGNTSRYAYDADGRLIRAEDAAGGFQTLARTENASGFTVTTATTLGRQTTYQVESLPTGERKATSIFPGSVKTEVLTKPDGTNTVRRPDGTIITTVLGPDPRFGMQAPIAQSLTITTPSGLSSSTTMSRTAVLSDPGNPLSLSALTDTVVVNGRTSTTTYTAATRTLVATSPEGRQSVATFDALGRVGSAQTAGLDPVSYTFDARGRLTAATQGTGVTARTTTFVHNAAGFLESVTDPLNRRSLLAYDAAGRVRQATLPDGRMVAYDYDARGNLSAIAPPGRSARTFSHNTVNLLSGYTSPDIGPGSDQTSIAYNLDRQPIRASLATGVDVTLGYDATSGRIQTGTIQRGTTSYAFDAVTGNLASITAPGGVVLTYGYDGSLPTSSTWSGTIASNVARTFDNDFRLGSQSVNGGRTIGFRYDSDGLLTSAGDLVVTRHPQHGRITSTTLGAVTDSRTYNGFAELTSYRADIGTTPLYATELVRDKLGRITQKTETIQGESATFTYSYDLAGRLTEVARNGVAIAGYTYDSNSNRSTGPGLATTYTYDAQDRLITRNGTTYGYTATGQLRTKSAAAGSTTYQYDEIGNLVGVTLPNGTGIDYVIDGNNRRIGKRVNGTLVQGFLYEDRLRPAAELDGTGNVVSRFVYAGGVNVPSLMIRGAATFRIITDHLGSPRLVVDAASGAVAQRLDYDEFGNVLLDTNPGFQPFGFAGGLYDAGTKLVRFGARDYDAEAGRWTAKDSDVVGQANLYEYAASDPMNLVDPLGNTPTETIEDLQGEIELLKGIMKRLEEQVIKEARANGGIEIEVEGIPRAIDRAKVNPETLKQLEEVTRHLQRLKSIRRLFVRAARLNVVLIAASVAMDVRHLMNVWECEGGFSKPFNRELRDTLGNWYPVLKPTFLLIDLVEDQLVD